jgi:putative pyruvate formate lyase activating enzyme
MCHANRMNGAQGYCRSGMGYHISSICIHKGEEPVISGKHGICNIFFSRCNLQCIYCQNFQISTLKNDVQENEYTLEEVVSRIEKYLDEGCTHVGFVSPSHVIPQLTVIIQNLRSKGRKPVFVYNSNAYDRVETLKTIEGFVDVYLPDLKYLDAELAGAYSGATDYPEIACAAIREMYRQKGSTLVFDDAGYATSGLIIRHLVLPGHVENSKSVLRFIAGELSPRVHVSLMSQYYPTPAVSDHPLLGRQLSMDEYRQVADEMEKLGLFRGWIQEPESHENYRPDFKLVHPFEP